MFIIKATIVLLSLIHQISANSDVSNLCNISSDYLSNIFEGIINEFKFQDIDIYKDNLKVMEEKLDNLEKQFGAAVKLTDFDMAILKLGHSTTVLKKKLNSSLVSLEVLGVEKNDSRILSVVSLIKSGEYKEAFKSYKQMGNDGLLFTIVHETYYTSKYTEAVTKLVTFTQHLLLEDRIQAVVFIIVELYHELINSGNVFSFDMMYFAEFVARVIHILMKDFQGNWDYQVLKGKLFYIELSVPRVVSKVVFEAMYHPRDWWCVRNKKWNEFLFIGEFQHGNNPHRRIVYTRDVNNMQNDLRSIRWKIHFNMAKVGYSLVNQKYLEFMYSTDNTLLYNVTNRFTFTRKEMGSKSFAKAFWIIEPINQEEFYIKNQYYDEYIYVPEQRTFYETYDMRRVFSYTKKGDPEVPDRDSQKWILEKC